MKNNCYLDTAFLERLMREHQPQKNIHVKDVQPLKVDSSASILAALTAGRSGKAIGHFGLSIIFEEERLTQTRKLVLKVKPHGREIVDMLAGLAGLCSPEVARVYNSYKARTGFQHTHLRELEVYRHLHGPLMPHIYGLQADQEQETYLILMEYLEEVTLLNSVTAPERWTDAHIKQALTQVAAWHATHLNRFPAINAAYWDDAPCRSYMLELTPLWEVLLHSAATTFPDLYTPSRAALLKAAIAQLPTYWQELEAMPKTFIHNDLNPRNTCFKGEGETLRFCVYDWELATWHVPQYDIVELLCFILDQDRYHLRKDYLAFYGHKLHALTGQFADAQAFQRGFALAALDFGLHRLGMYLMAHAVNPYPFLPRVVNSYFNTLEQFRPFAN